VQRLCESWVFALRPAWVFVIAVTLMRVLVSGLALSCEADGGLRGAATLKPKCHWAESRDGSQYGVLSGCGEGWKWWWVAVHVEAAIVVLCESAIVFICGGRVLFFSFLFS
jgi:hypothetical protein